MTAIPETTHAEVEALGGRAGGRSVTVAGQGLGQRLRPGAVRRAVHDRAVAGLELGDPLPGEGCDGLAATLLRDVAQRARGEVVVGLVEGVPSCCGHREQPRRPATAAGEGGPGLPLLDQAVGQQRVEMAADGGRREPEPLGERSRGRRAALEDDPRDPHPGAVLDGGFHNTSVALFVADRKPPGLLHSPP